MIEQVLSEENFNYRFKNVLEMEFKKVVEDHSWDQDLRVLGFNSISFIKMVVALENEFDFEFEGANLDLDGFTTLGEFRRMVYLTLEKGNDS